MKQIINLADGTLVEIDGTNVKHINANGSVLYDSARRIMYNEEQIESIRRRLNVSPTVESMLENLRPYLEEDIEE